MDKILRWLVYYRSPGDDLILLILKSFAISFYSDGIEMLNSMTELLRCLRR